LFTLEEKQYLLALLKKQGRFFLFRKKPRIHDQLREKLEQMIRNEKVNLDRRH
jgi:hypothetical protein